MTGGAGGDLDVFPAAATECPQKSASVLRDPLSFFPSLQWAFLLSFLLLTLSLLGNL